VGTLPGVQAGQLRFRAGESSASKGSGEELVDLTEEDGALARVTSMLKTENSPSPAVPERVSQQVTNTNGPTKSAALYHQIDSTTKLPLGRGPFVSLISIRVRESTSFCFINASNELNRTRQFDTCDSVGKLFLQADVGSIVQKSDEEAALSLNIPGNNRPLIIPNKDEESFKELVEAIANARCWEDGGESAKCRVEVRRYG